MIKVASKEETGLLSSSVVRFRGWPIGRLVFGREEGWQFEADALIEGRLRDRDYGEVKLRAVLEALAAAVAREDDYFDRLSA